MGNDFFPRVRDALGGDFLRVYCGSDSVYLEKQPAQVEVHLPEGFEVQ